MKKTRILSLILGLVLLLGLCPTGVSATESAEPKVVSQQLKLGDDLTMRFSVTAEANTVVNVTVNGETNAYDLSTMKPDSNGQYGIAAKLSAAQMTEEITLDFLKNGASVLQKTYSIRDYAVEILEGNDPACTKKLVRNMLNYGASAQQYFGVNTGSLANAGYELTEAAALPAEYAEMAIDGSIDGIRFYGASLVFESKIAVRYYFKADSVEGVTFTANGVTYRAVEKNGMFYIEVPGINPQQYADSIVLTAAKGEQTLSVSYSPLNYIIRMTEKGSNSLKALLNALYGYHEAAVEYVTKRSFFGTVGDYYTTSHVNLSADTGANTGTVTVSEDGIAFGYIDSFEEESFYFETKIHVDGIKSTEYYPKFGLFVRNGNVRENFYVDMKTDLTATKVGRMTNTDDRDDWTAAKSVTVSDMAFSGEGETITMGVLKDGKYLHLFVNGAHVLSYESGFEGTAVAGIFSFNTGMTLTEYFTDLSEETMGAKKALIPRYVVTKGDESVMSYDAATDTITIDMDSSDNRNQAQLYDNGVLVEGDCYAVTGHIKIENTPSSGTAAGKIEFQMANGTSDFVKATVYRYEVDTTRNNSVYINAADSGNGMTPGGYAKPNGDGTFTITGTKTNNLSSGDPYEVDYQMILENGTVYLVLDGQLVYRFEGTFTSLSYYFGVTQYADVTYTNTRIIYDSDEVAKLTAPHRAESNNGITLTTNHASVNADSGIYTLNTDTAVAETVLKDGALLNETYYKVGGTIYNNGTADWAQAQITVKADDTHAVRFVLERTDKGYYQVFTEKNFEDENWAEWTGIILPNNKTINRMNFDVAVIQDKLYLIIDDMVYYSTQYAGIFEKSFVTIGGQNVSMTLSSLNGTVFADEAEAQSYVDSKAAYQYISNYKSAIQNRYNTYFGSGVITHTGGTLMLGSSTIDFWGNSTFCGENNWTAMTGLVDGVTGYNVGIGGTCVEDWLYAYDKLIAPFDASRFIIYVGGNDIGVKDDSGANTAAEVIRLLEKIHADFPDSEINFIYTQICPSNYANGAFKNPEYAEYVRLCKEYCEAQDWIIAYEANHLLKTEDGLNPKPDLFYKDNVHMNEAGYGIWGQYLYEMIFADDPKPFFGSAGGYSTTRHVDITKDTGANTGTVTVSENGIAFGYIRDFQEEEFYFETKIHVNGILSTESYPKFGLFVRNGNVRENFYVDMKTDLTATKVGRMTNTDGKDDWTAAESVTVSDIAFSGEGETITMGVLKEGKYLHLFVNGVHALSYESDFEGTAVAGIFSFNTGMTLTEYYTDSAAETITAKKALLPRYVITQGNASVMSYDAATDTITIDMDSSNTRNQAQLYDHGMPVLSDRFAVTGTIKVENTKKTGSAASKIEFQMANGTSNFVKATVFRFEGTQPNNSVYINVADSGNGMKPGGYANPNGDGTFTITGNKDPKPNNLASGDPYEVDYQMILENGTVYLVLDGELVYRFEGTFTSLSYYFGVTQYADVTYTNTQVIYDAEQIAALTAPYRTTAAE